MGVCDQCFQKPHSSLKVALLALAESIFEAGVGFLEALIADPLIDDESIDALAALPNSGEAGKALAFTIGPLGVFDVLALVHGGLLAALA